MLQQQQDRLSEAFRDRLGGFVREALEDPTVIEVMVNGCGRVWLDTLDRGRIATDTVMHPAAAEAIIRLVAHHIGATANEDKAAEQAMHCPSKFAIHKDSARLLSHGQQNPWAYP